MSSLRSPTCRLVPRSFSAPPHRRYSKWPYRAYLLRPTRAKATGRACWPVPTRPGQRMASPKPARPRYETVEALPRIISGLQAKGYTFVAICGPYRPTASAAPPAPHALVLSVRARPPTLAPGGGTVVVTGRVEHATSCQLQLLSHQPFPVVYSHNPTTACRSGSYSAHLVIGANPSPVSRTVAFGLVARNGPYSFLGRFYVVLAAPPVPRHHQ